MTEELIFSIILSLVSLCLIGMTAWVNKIQKRLYRNETNLILLAGDVSNLPKSDEKAEVPPVKKRKPYKKRRPQKKDPAINVHELRTLGWEERNLQDLPGEAWKNIKGFSGKYQISNRGRVRSLIGNKQILKGVTTKNGYRWVSLRRNNSVSNLSIGQLYLDAFRESPKKLLKEDEGQQITMDNFFKEANHGTVNF